MTPTALDVFRLDGLPDPPSYHLAEFPFGVQSIVSARSPIDPDSGVCIPPYFLFQMRVDGHLIR